MASHASSKGPSEVIHSTTTLLNWSHREATLGDGKTAFQRVATPDECQKIAAALGILRCCSLEASYQIISLTQNRYRVTGTYHGLIEQACTITLEPVPSELGEEFDIEFRPEEQLKNQTEVELGDPNVEDPEPIVGGCLEVGALIYELAASQLDPYPRKEGAQLEMTEALAPPASQGNMAFAKLASLKFSNKGPGH